ncbi:MAG TPA: cyclic nucleotide-binding domain-containing protein [Desulfobacterales bacterium]|jgi:CRP-like cAMP-binding protein|nr:cyclic nucleotide-binding domain-containing protein [Desulfobacterales bacterium]
MLTAVVDSLCNVPLFDRLNGDELTVLAGYVNVIEVKRGEYIFKEGDRGDFICFVEKGSLDVMKKSSAGGNVIIATLTKGRSIGEMSVIDHFPRSATVRARAETTLLTLTRTRFDLILEQYPIIGIKILKEIARLLSQNLRRTSSQLADYMLPLT